MESKDLLKMLGTKKALFLILALTFVVYMNSLTNGFVWDDWIFIVDNEAYKSIDLGKIFLSRANYFEYLPVYHLTLALDAQVWGMRPFGFHLTNILIYLGIVAVLFSLVKNLARITGEQEDGFMAFGITLIFALHPLHAEPVNFIINRNHMLAAFFILLSLNFLVQGVLKRRDLLFLFSAAFFIIALFSKQVAVFYPVFLALMLFLFIPSGMLSFKRKIIILLGFMIADLIAVLIHLSGASLVAAVNENAILYGMVDWKHVFARTLQIPLFYLRMLLVPYPMNVVYNFHLASGNFILKTVLSAVAIITILFAAWKIRRKRALLAIGIIWFFVSLGPVLNIFPTGPVVADRYAFLPTLGFAIAAAYALRAALSKNRYCLYIGVAVVLAFCIIIVDRNTDWKSDVSLWESALVANSDMERGNLANALWAQKQYERALSLLKEEWDKTGSHRYNFYQGKYMMENGRYSEAIKFFKTSLDEGGDAWKENHFYLAVTYEKTGADMQALDQYLKTIEAQSSLDYMRKIDEMASGGAERVRNRLMPDLKRLRDRALSESSNFKLQAQTAFLFQNLGLYEDAERFYLLSLQVDPSSWKAWYNLGLVYIKLKKHRESIKAFERSLAENPNNKNTYNNLGSCYMKVKNYTLAAQNFEAALKIDPTFTFPIFNLGMLHFMTGNGEESRRYFTTAKSLAVDDPAFQRRIDQYLRRIK